MRKEERKEKVDAVDKVLADAEAKIMRRLDYMGVDDIELEQIVVTSLIKVRRALRELL